jgi:sugar-phosphatase
MAGQPITLGTIDGLRIDCRAVLFDMDGVLVDSLAVVERHLRHWATARGLDPARVVELSPGRTNADLVRLVAPGLDPKAETDFLIRQDEQDLRGITACAGAAELVSRLPTHAWAVVTSAYRAVAVNRLRYANLPTPATLITADDVARGKPDPAGYRAAATAVGVPPGDCVVIEDAASGIAAARAAGMPVIGVAASGRDRLPADVVVTSLAQLRCSAPG